MSPPVSRSITYGATRARARGPMQAKYSDLVSPTRPPAVIPGLTADGKVRLRWRRPSQSHCSTMGIRLSHFGMRSNMPTRRRAADEVWRLSATWTIRSLMPQHLIANGLVREVVRLPGGARRQADQQVHLRLEHDVVAGLAQRRLDPDHASDRIDRHVHEHVERGRDGIRRYPVWRQRLGQVAEAAAVRLGIAVDDAEHLRRTRRQQEIMAADGVLGDAQHHPTAIGVDRVAGAEVDPAGVVDAAPGRDRLRRIAPVERDQVGHLLALRIDHLQPLVALQLEGDATARGNRADHRCTPESAARNGHCQSAPTTRPLYWRASEFSPCAASIGFAEPAYATSRRTIAWRSFT